jgi:hypothetical protein
MQGVRPRGWVAWSGWRQGWSRPALRRGEEVERRRRRLTRVCGLCGVVAQGAAQEAGEPEPHLSGRLGGGGASGKGFALMGGRHGGKGSVGELAE